MTNQQIEAAVEHPAYYNKGSIEIWDFTADHRLDFLRGNAVKYICRAGHKLTNTDDQIKAKIIDLRKAIEYLKKALFNTTYPRETSWTDYTPEINPVEFARDQQLDPPLAAALVLICQWDVNGAIYYVNVVLDDMQNEAKKKHRPPVVYGTNEERFADNRNDTRVYEFGKRI